MYIGMTEGIVMPTEVGISSRFVIPTEAGTLREIPIFIGMTRVTWLTRVDDG